MKVIKKTGILLVMLAFSVSALAIQPKSLDIIGISDIKEANPELDGSGLVVGVIARSKTYQNGIPQNDYRPNILHRSFRNTNFIFNDRATVAPGISDHSTQICSILFGNDANVIDPDLGEFQYRSLLPGATADVYEFWYFLINYVFPARQPDVDLINIGFGSPTQQWWTRGINAMAQSGVPIVASIGNGTDVFEPTLYPGAGPNIIAVGVVDEVETKDLAQSLEHFTTPNPYRSSAGPTEDGRTKPDIVAPGNSLAADAVRANSYEATGSWTSFSAPLVSGTLGLLIQRANDDPELQPLLESPVRNCVFKAVLMNSADKLPHWRKGDLGSEDDHLRPLDFIQGAGMLNASAAMEQFKAGRQTPGSVNSSGWDFGELDKNKLSNSYRFELADPNQMISVTASWNFHFRQQYPFESIPEKNADFQIQLWAVDPANAENSYLLDYSDSPNDNVEHIYTAADPNYTNYEIVISFSPFTDPDLAPTEKYALAWTTKPLADLSHSIENPLWYDLNGDGMIDEADIEVLRTNIQLFQQGDKDIHLIGDIDQDGRIDENDMAILREFIETRPDTSVTE